MREPPTNICPLLAIANVGRGDASASVCLGSRCAWWDFGGSECVMVTAVTAVQEIAENLEALASKSQTFGILDKKTPAGAANTDEGKAEKALENSDSASHDIKD